MSWLDLLLVASAVLAGMGGYRLGFIAHVLSWVGLLGGAAAGYAALPAVTSSLGPGTSSSELVLVAIVLVTSAALAGQLLGSFVGGRLRTALPEGAGRQTDRVLGAAAGVTAVALIAWVLLPVMAGLAGWPARQARDSRVADALGAVLPEAPDASRLLGDLLGEDYPEVFSGGDPTGDVGTPPPASGLSQGTAEAVARSTVKVVGEACGAISVGSGWVAEPGLVVTNAHVVAGQAETEVETTDGVRHRATVVAFDPGVDLAVLAAPTLDRPALARRPAARGDIGGVFGHPGGRPLRVAPFEVANDIVAVGTDIYDERTVERDVLVLAADLERGDSGSPLVDPSGAVVGVAFAVGTDRSGVAYALTVEEVDAALASVSGTAASTGGCAA
ncbi:MAG: MarP family serine protease [Acidimicrobiales bacterium]|nr:MarP family serine protease [Acidimicrobiales bacterium]